MFNDDVYNDFVPRTDTGWCATQNAIVIEYSILIVRENVKSQNRGAITGFCTVCLGKAQPPNEEKLNIVFVLIYKQPSNRLSLTCGDPGSDMSSSLCVPCISGVQTLPT